MIGLEDKQRIKNVSSRKVMGVICAVIIILFVGSVLASTNGEEKEVNIFGYRPVVVVSGSMEPEILTNSISIMQYCSIDDIKVGDIVMYKQPELGINITHRVLKKDIDEVGNIYLITKGDANSSADNIKVTSDLLVGKIVATYNNTVKYVNFVMLENGEINTFALLQVIIFISVLIAIIFIVLYFIWSVVYAVFIVAFGKKYSDNVIKRYKDNVEKQQSYAGIVENLKIKRGDSIRLMIGKIVLVRGLKVFEQAVEDLEKTKTLAKYISNNQLEDKGEWKDT